MKKTTSKKKEELPIIAILIEGIKHALDAVMVDAEKFDKGTMAAGTRVRVKMQEIKTIAKEIRDAVTKVKVARKETK